MTAPMAKVTCPTCSKTYQIQLEQKGISQTDEIFQLACHSCGTVWTPRRAAKEHKPKEMPSAAPTQPPTRQPDVAPTYAPPPPQSPPPAPPAWTPPPYVAPTAPTAPPPPPFIPPQPLSPPKRSIGSTIGLLVLGTCVIMACIVGILRHKEGKPLTWLTTKNVFPNPDQTNVGGAELTIRDVRFDVQQTGKRQTILVVGMIDNATRGAFTLHPLQVSVWGPADQEGVSPTAPKDKDGQCLLISWQHPFDVLHIEPGKSRPFQTVGSLPAGLQISRVDVTLP